MPCMKRKAPKDISSITATDFIKMVSPRRKRHRGYVCHIIETDAVPALRQAASEELRWFA